MKQNKAKSASAEREQIGGLHRWNFWISIAYALQAFAIFVFSQTHVFPVTMQYLAKDAVASSVAGHTVLALASRHLFDINLAGLLIVFFLIAAGMHAAVASFYRTQYEAGLKKRINLARWAGYALTMGLIVVAIGLASGITDLATLLLIFGGTVLMNILGFVGELASQKARAPFLVTCWVGAFVAVLVLASLGIYLFGTNLYDDTAPVFTYWLYASLIAYFVGLGLHTYLLRRKRGRWANYVYGERVYIVISFAANALLAWQLFAGALRS